MPEAPRRRSVIRAALAIVTFTTVLGIRISPWPAEPALAGSGRIAAATHADARADAMTPAEGIAILWLGLAAALLARAFSRSAK